jgi:ketosteroid isomerase-like protein
MKRYIAVGSLVILVSLLLLAFTAAAQDTKYQNAAAVEQELIAMEKDWTQAALKKDIAVIDRIAADDWVGIDFTGKTFSKADIINEVKSGASAPRSIELGPMKVRVYGDTAVVNGSDTEKSTWQGKDSSGHYVWTDVFVKRNGRWQAVSSQSTKTQ